MIKSKNGEVKIKGKDTQTIQADLSCIFLAIFKTRVLTPGEIMEAVSCAVNELNNMIEEENDD